MTIPSRKIYRDSRGTHHGRNYPASAGGCTGNSYVITAMDWSDVSYSEMGRQRPKPSKLLPTPALFFDNQANMATLGCQNRYNSKGFGYGPHNTVHSGEPQQSLLRTPTSADVNRARIQSRNRMNEHGASFGETFATLKQTGGMISKRGFQLAEVALQLRKGNFKAIAGILGGEVPGSVRRLPPARRLADGWLELEFGWKPLLSDVYTALDVFHNTVVNGQIVNARGNAVTGGFGPKTQTSLDHGNRIIKNGANVSVKTYATVSNSTVATLNDLGLINPLLIAWQTLPFSFVVDWFLPISNYLSALTSGLGFKIEGECVVQESLQTTQYQCGVLGLSFRTVDRWVSANYMLAPSLKWNPSNSSVWRVGTATALLAQRFGR